MKVINKLRWVFSHEMPCTLEEYEELKTKQRVYESMSRDAHATTDLYKASTDKLYQLITEAQDLELLNRKASDVMNQIRSVTGHSYKPDYIPKRLLWNQED